ncbi:hypothetical protein [Paenibacillus pini]|uniref:Uncharacterized protein n=1 Tax=Paenibacillus pini JCM 16418 TaxID=1236976 RepID=W7Z341_9BACL|nr:hypothetical protein [Paenibacillus pini]GAF08884.1 hypothetical protein JCM16418_2994 [Paenibacillus pini JCM 16418]
MSFDDLLSELQGQKTIQEDPNNVPLDKLFNESFMSKHSAFSSFDEFLKKGNFQVDTQEDVNNIPDELFDRHVSRETDFSDWESMLAQANKDYSAE